MATTIINKTNTSSEKPKKVVTGGKAGDRLAVESGEAVLQTKARGFVKRKTKPVTLISASPHDGLSVYSNKWRNLIVEFNGNRIDSRKIIRVKRSEHNDSWIDFFVRDANGFVKTDKEGVPFFDRKEGEVRLIKTPAVVTCNECLTKDKTRSKKPRFWKRIAGTVKNK